MTEKLTTLKAIVDSERMNNLLIKSIERFKEFEQEYLEDTDNMIEGYLKDVCEYVLICHDVIRLEIVGENYE